MGNKLIQLGSNGEFSTIDSTEIEAPRELNKMHEYVISQSSHGFSLNDIIAYDDVTDEFIKAQADNATNAEVVGFVISVVDTNTFTLGMTKGGYCDGFTGLTAGNFYYLDPTTAGAYTNVEPTTNGQIRKPLFQAISTTQIIWHNYLGSVLTTAPGGSTVDELNDLSDVALATPVEGDALVYNGSNWVNMSLSLLEIGDLANVDSNTPTTGHLMYWDGSQWTFGIPNVSDLGEFSDATPSDSDILVWNNTNGEWTPTSLDLTLSDLDDTNVGSPSNLDVLMWDSGSSKWIPASVGTASAFPLQDLTNVTISNLQTLDGIFWNGSTWVNASLGLGDLDGVDLTGLTGDQLLYYDGSDWILATPDFISFDDGSGDYLSLDGLRTNGTSGTSFITINTHLGPTGSGFDIGGSTNRWDTGFFSSLNVTGTISSPTTITCGTLNATTVNESDRRSKENIKDITISDEIIKDIEPVEFTWKDKRDTKRHYGVIAQDIEKVLLKYGIDNNGIIYYDKEKDKYAVGYTQMIPLLIKTCQNLMNRVEELEKRIEEIEK